MRTFLAGLLFLLSFSALSAPAAELWPRFGGYGTNKAEIDHSAWDLFLRKNLDVGLDGINRVAYAKVSAEDRKQLGSYLEMLQGIRITDYPRDAQRAFWTNLYNAATVKVILDHYPVESIRDIDISPGFFSDGPWGKKLLVVEGEPVSLDDIEHRILRPIWGDPRTHYSVNCASLGCPNLPRRAFTPSNLDKLLDDGARAFINHPRGVRIHEGKLELSSIYKWFADDFGANEAAIIEHLRKYASRELRKKLEGQTSVDDYQYDWTLNDITTKKDR